ncbi:pilus (MSHA type) biogenesis protein MshL [Pseudoalteromonas denitrificans]|uniref:MSHA biogenesis protein MshL n=1 Tax=Pseudoalteromonas denitrificans DSM 6059 TaxID=1123010 RepID=A0A1I1DQD0_9GAMM|nr:pilus (MSHA type) biogenesis protein MshL [Pseudoalteromonas denitrificans]SFB77209.1 MSHA biogenesis protein MshL [Pseudoalteromonas denitrificans DSM 6059]
MKLNVKKIYQLSMLSLAMSLLSACEITNDDSQIKPFIVDELTPKTKNKTVDESVIPQALAQELLSSVGSDLLVPKELDIKRFEVAANEVEIRDFFVGLVDDTPYSVAVHPEVTGKISLNLKDVSLDEVIKVIVRMYEIDVFREGKVVQVLPARLRTESIPVNYLMMTRSGSSSVSVVAGGVSQFDQGAGNSSSSGNLNNSVNNQSNSSGSGSGGSSGSSGGGSQLNGANIQSASETDFWGGLKTALEAIVGKEKGRYIIVSPQAGLVTVKALPSEIASLKRFLNKSEESLQRQVVLEAKVIEVTLKDDYQQGVNWTEVLGHVASTDIGFGSAIGSDLTTLGKIAAKSTIKGNSISAGLGGAASLVFKNADFSGVINLLETQGDVQMLSNPRVTAVNNQKAVIKVGQDEYFVTDVSSTTVTGNSTTTTPEIELTPFFTGIALDVTPQIDANGSVILHVHPSVTETAEQEKTITLNNEQFILPLAQSNIREADTIIRAASGEIVVIGGLMQTVTTDEESKTPFLGDLPVLGNLFKSIRKRQEKKELIILIKPTVVMVDSWKKQQQRTMKLLQSWYSN